jgi:outer membrane protein insertion porin family
MIFLLGILLNSFIVFADSFFTINEINVQCTKSHSCSTRKQRFKSMLGDYRSLPHFKDTLRVLASEGGYKVFSYRLEKINDQYVLFLSFQLKPIIHSIDISFKDSNFEMDPVQLISLREGDYFESQNIDENMRELKERLSGVGFPENSSSYEVIEKEDSVRIFIKTKLGKPRIFKKINTNVKSIFVQGYLKRKFLNLYNKPFDFNKFKIYLDEAQKELFHYGYYLVSLDFNPVYKKNRVILNINVSNDQLFAFDFINIKREHRDIIHRLVVDLFRRYKRPLSETSLISEIKEHYRQKAFLNTDIKLEKNEFKNSSNEIVQLYRILFIEKEKTRFSTVSFSGNKYFTKKRLKKMFEKEAFELASLHYYDEEYFNYFQDFLRNKYLEKGFVQAKVFDPIFKMKKNREVTKIEYSIQEGTQALIRKIEFIGLTEDLEKKVLKELKLKEGMPFNPIKMLDNSKLITEILQEDGYYYAEVLNSNDNDLVKYNKQGTNVDISYKIELGPVVRLNRVLFIGNDKTRKKVLSKKIFLEKGDLITPSTTREIETALSSTGLFNTVSVSPLRHSSKQASTDLLVKVTERDYGLLEIAPGYRTDLGIKLTGTITYQNIGGYNRSISLRSQLNRRTSFTTVDPGRRDNIKHIIEHNTSVTYNQGDIFDTLIDGAASAAYQTRRFYAFDANIFRVNGTLTRDLSKTLSSSVRYQYEDISQYSATEEINNGSFQIGSLTPSLSYDLRNAQTNPVRGAFFNLSCEFANPYLLSQKQSDLTINYYKLISRNRFYIPFKNGTVALSMVGGVQKNLANRSTKVDGVEQSEGYIPTIKVFRLTGMDIIRGFTDEEMNRLPNGQDISEVRVIDKAYMANLKFEPRYFLNDALMAGVFYDAGRVFVNNFSTGEFRDSVGVTFKIVTPVGTLDFDYGIKLLRKKDPSGRLEDPGRFHVSIGFF